MRPLKAAFTIVAVPACLYAVISPAGYALLFAYVRDSSAFFDAIVAVSCIILLTDIFRRLNFWIFSPAFAVLLAASLAGLLFHFRSSGESGPLPFEWLNGYHLRSTPLLLVSAAARLFLHNEPNRA